MDFEYLSAIGVVINSMGRSLDRAIDENEKGEKEKAIKQLQDIVKMCDDVKNTIGKMIA